MSIFEQLQAAESRRNHILSVEAKEVESLWENARIASKKHAENLNRVDIELFKLRKQWQQLNSVMRCG